MMNHLKRFLITILLVGLLQVSLTACADIKRPNEASSSRRSFTVTVYSGSDVVREWNNVHSCTTYNSGLVDIIVDGKDVYIVGGTVIVEEESN